MSEKIPIYTSMGRLFFQQNFNAEKFESGEKFVKALDENIDYNNVKRIEGGVKRKESGAIPELFSFGRAVHNSSDAPLLGYLYFISMVLSAFLASSWDNFGKSMVKTPCSTPAEICSLSTSSGKIIVCWNLEYENSRRK